jgi:prepilin-type N-terminal cleavage/methylation domain-containing protein
MLRRGFTLAELLIVVSIIAVLIGILLPALSAARRPSASVKCLSSLKQIGTAFQMYAQENRRFFPVMRWQPNPAVPSVLGGGGISATEDPDGNNKERVWIDFLGKYLVKKETFSNPKVYAQFQYSSVLWGCPSFDNSLFDPNDTYPSPIQGSKRYSMGYGMGRGSLGPYKNSTYTDVNATPAGPGGVAPVMINGTNYSIVNLADIHPSINGNGQFFKMEQWGR